MVKPGKKERVAKIYSSVSSLKENCNGSVQKYLNLNDTVCSFLEKSLYIPNFQKLDIKKQFERLSDINNIIENLFREFFRLNFKNIIKILSSIRKIEKNIAYIDTHNKDIIEKEISQDYEVEGYKLDSQQIESVVACEDASLVIAAAGSGKTLSLVAKLKYIVERLEIPINKVLIISFTNSTTNDLKKRVKKLGFKQDNVKTFHSLGNQILKISNVKKKRVVKGSEINKIITDIVTQLFNEDSDYSRKYNDYLLNYHTTPIHPGSIKNLNDIITFNRSYLRKSLKQISLDKDLYDVKKPTMKGEYIRSKEEQIIANFLYINQIPYEYERQYPYVKTKYTPDFTIDEFNDPVYLEHFGIDRESHTHPSIDNLRYLSEMNWKRNTHKENNTILLESFTYQWQEGSLLKHIEKELNRVGKKLNRMDESVIYELLKKNYTEDSNSFEELLLRFLTLFKNSPYSMKELQNKISSIKNEYQRLRLTKFIEIFKPVFDKYSEKLQGDDLIDFADMIRDATKIVNDLPIKSFDYDYILVDEAQDLSFGKFSLLKALLDKNPGARLFCVGDDWQSIYRFTGSDLTLIQDFEEHFERKTYFSKIEKTYRFGEPTIQQSSEFITKNPNQIQKNIVSNRDASTLIKIHLCKSKDVEAGLVESVLIDLSSRYSVNELKNKKIQILSRYNKDIAIFDDYPNFEIKDVSTNNITKMRWISNIIPEGLDIEFSSMHKAKGLTKDIIIILNCNEGHMGMPATHEDDPILEVLLAHSDNYPYSEERRLFYVAITRAKEETHLIAIKDNPSRFLFEIDPNLDNEERELCPVCRTGVLVLRKSEKGDFKGCSNYTFGCNYTESLSFKDSEE